MLEFENQDIRLVTVETVAVGAELMSALAAAENVLVAMVAKLTNHVHCLLLHHSQILNHAAKVLHVVRKTSILIFHLLGFEFK